MFASRAVTTSASAGGGWVSTIRPGAAASTTIRGRTIGTIISGHSAGFEDAARRERPCDRSAAKQHGEFAAVHSITSSARPTGPNTEGVLGLAAHCPSLYLIQ